MTCGAADSAANRYVDFKRHLRPEIRPGDGAYLFSERGVVTMRGTQVASLAALLDGTRDLDTLLGALPDDMDAGQATALLARLVEEDLVTLRAPGDLGLDERELAYWDACGVDAGAATRRDTAVRVGLATVGDGVHRPSVRGALRDAGLDVVREDAAADLSVVVCEDYLDPRLGEIDAAHRRTGRPWLLAKPVGAQVWLGPILRPGESGCWHCLTHRLWGHRYAEAAVQAELGHTGPARCPLPALPSLTSAAAHLIALEATKWLAGYRYQGQSCVWVLDTLDLNGRRHELRRRPQCAECGDPSLMAEQARSPVELRPAPKATSQGGGHRTLTSVQVLESFRHLVSPVTGIIKEIIRDPNAPPFVHAYRSGPNIARNVTSLAGLRSNLRAENGGKGVTSVDAEAGALCEAAERFSGTFQGDELRIPGSLHDLGADAVDPNSCMLFDDRQFAARTAWNADHAGFQYVCRPVDEHAVLDWTPLWSLTGQRQRLLPTGLLYFGAPDPDGRNCVLADSNGNAAGSSLEDAILQGTLELVERDAVALWWYNRTRVPGVDLAAFAEPWLEETHRQYESIGRELWALDLTADLGIPVMAALSRSTVGPTERIMLGFGAHLDPRVALRRAVTELNQLLPGVLAEQPELDDPDATRWLRHATIANQAYLRPQAGAAARTPGDVPFVRREDVRDDVEALVGTLAGHGLETLVLDQTRPDIELPVVKMVVPGLRPFWSRFAPGRLFDVPVRLGRLAAPTPYDQLNPFPMFL